MRGRAAGSIEMGLIAILGVGLVAQPRPSWARITVAGEPETVWRYDGGACSRRDFSDVPARPFIVQNGKVLWFAGNTNANLVTEGDRSGSDLIAKFHRAGCAAWLVSPEFNDAVGGNPANYHSGLWMSSPWTADGMHVYALVHQEFHGEWTGDRRFCSEQNERNRFVPPCSYWNVISAQSDDAGASFHLLGEQPNGRVTPAIALPDPFQPVSDSGASQRIEQGMIAQSNIIQWGNYWYVLVTQLLPGPLSNPLDGACIYRAASLRGPVVWRGWNAAHRAYDVISPLTYPEREAPLEAHCTPVLPRYMHFTWTYNTVLHRFITVGINPHASNGAAVVAITFTLDPRSGEVGNVGSEQTVLAPIAWGRALHDQPDKTGFGYPSILDPTSPTIRAPEIPNPTPGDRNFQYSGAAPYLYYTRDNPVSQTRNFFDRDVARMRLSVTPD